VFVGRHNVFRFEGMVGQPLGCLNLGSIVPEQVDNFGNTDSNKNDLAERQITNLILNAEVRDSFRILKDCKNFELKVSNFDQCFDEDFGFEGLRMSQ
jgi:hypothetical protein